MRWPVVAFAAAAAATNASNATNIVFIKTGKCASTQGAQTTLMVSRWLHRFRDRQPGRVALGSPCRSKPSKGLAREIASHGGEPVVHTTHAERRFVDLGALARPAFVWTAVRHPLSRCLSWFYFQNKRKPAAAIGAGAGTKCQGNAWKDGPSPYDPAHADGYCDCAPDCADCDGPGPADGALGVTSSSCDARNGTAPASDWANCWNSCVDCMGDDLSHQGIAKYMPEAMGQQIVGTANWTTYNVGHYNGTGTWWLCKTDSPTQKGDCAWMGKADGLPMGPKFKGLALCA
jgi:hypothetical protein